MGTCVKLFALVLCFQETLQEVIGMATPLNLCCPRRFSRDGRRIKCNLPLGVIRVDDAYVYLRCSRGHSVRYTLKYFSRFQIVLPKGQSIPTPQMCPNCHSAPNPDADTINRGLVTCGVCGVTLVWNEGRQEWETAEVQ